MLHQIDGGFTQLFGLAANLLVSRFVRHKPIMPR